MPAIDVVDDHRPLGDTATLCVAQAGAGGVAPTTPAAELAARLKRCLPCLRGLALSFTPATSAGHGDDGYWLPHALLELALGLPWSLRSLRINVHGSGLRRAQLQALLQGLADAGRSELGIQLRVVAITAPAAASQPAAPRHAGRQPLRVSLQRAGLIVSQRHVTT